MERTRRQATASAEEKLRVVMKAAMTAVATASTLTRRAASKLEVEWPKSIEKAVAAAKAEVTRKSGGGRWPEIPRRHCVHTGQRKRARPLIVACEISALQAEVNEQLAVDKALSEARREQAATIAAAAQVSVGARAAEQALAKSRQNREELQQEVNS